MTTVTSILDDSAPLPAPEADRVRFDTARPSLDKLDHIGPASAYPLERERGALVWLALGLALSWALCLRGLVWLMRR